MQGHHFCGGDRGNPRRGPSSFWMHDHRHVFTALALRPGHRFVDLGCGPGDYALAAAEIVGPTGRVYALDIWPSMVGSLKTEARRRGISNLHAMVVDITATLPFTDAAMDVCLIATVLHIPKVTCQMAAIGSEVRRVLKPGGRLAIIECKKEAASFGPPLDLRLAPEEIERPMAEAGFRSVGVLELGPNYLIHLVS